MSLVHKRHDIASVLTRDVQRRSDSLSYWLPAILGIGISLGALILAYWDTFASMVRIWLRSDTFAHGFLVVPISAYLIWKKRPDLSKLTPLPSIQVLVLLLLLGFSWLLSYLGNVLALQQLSAVLMIPTLIWALVGKKAFSQILFPLSYLVFAVPLGEFLVPILQDFTAAFVVHSLQISGMPVNLEGRYIHIPSGTFEVAEACSGLRYLIASLALGALYAYLMYQTTWRRVVFMALAVLVPIVANGIRAFIIVMLAHYSGYKLAVGVDHIIYGWIFFGLVMLLLFWAGSFLRESDVTEAQCEVKDGKGRGIRNYVKAYVIYTFIVTGALLAPQLAAQRVLAGTDKLPTLDLRLPESSKGWVGPSLSGTEWKPAFQGPAAEARADYKKGNARVSIYIAYYSAQKQGAELINAGNKAYDSSRWQYIKESFLDIDLPDGGTLPIRSTIVSSAGLSHVLWQWYEVGGISTANPLMAKLLQVRGLLFGELSGAATIILVTDFEMQEEDAKEVLADYIQNMLPQIRRTLMP